MRLRLILPALLVASSFAFVAVRASSRASSEVACPEIAAPLVFVDTTAHRLALCENTKLIDSFVIRIGRSGTGKTREADGKTPLGSYALFAPRASAQFGTFIPVGYPTQEQRRAGFTGGAVGVHGPTRAVRAIGAFTNLFDTTDGCVGVGTDEEMSRVAAFVRTRKVSQIVLK